MPLLPSKATAVYERCGCDGHEAPAPWWELPLMAGGLVAIIVLVLLV